MTLLLPASRRAAEDFADALDGGTAREPAVVSLFALADELASLSIGPDERFRSHLRRRVLALAADPPPRVLHTGLGERLHGSLMGWRTQRRLALAAGMVVVVLLTAGIGLLGSRSLPGDPFYAAKRTFESAQLATAHGKLARGHRHLEFAAVRLHEVSALVGRNRALVAAGPHRVVAGRLALSPHTTELVVRTIRDMDRETVAGTRDLTEYWRESGQSRPLQALGAFATGQQRQLAAVLPTLPVSARTPGLNALALINSVSDRATALIAQGPCDAACRAVAGGPTMSGGFDTLGPLPCPDVCPGSGAGSAPAAIVTEVGPTPAATVSTSPSTPPAPTGEPSSGSETPKGVPSEPTPSISDSPSELPPPSLSPLPSPIESTTPPVPVETSPPPTSTPSLEPSPTETPSASASESPSPPAPTETGSPTPGAYSSSSPTPTPPTTPPPA